MKMKDENPWDYYLPRKSEIEDRNKYLEMQASIMNSWIKDSFKTKFKEGELALLDGRHVVVIVAVQPKGYVTVPARSDGPFRKTYPAVTNDVTIYQYKHLGSGYNDKYSGRKFDGQTTEKYLTKIEDK